MAELGASVIRNVYLALVSPALEYEITAMF
jgi:hypothetical protein